MASYKLINLDSLGDERGSLIAIEKGNNSPFEIKRYIILIQDGVVRGLHAHINLTNSNSKWKLHFYNR